MKDQVKAAVNVSRSARGLGPVRHRHYGLLYEFVANACHQESNIHDRSCEWFPSVGDRNQSSNFGGMPYWQ